MMGWTVLYAFGGCLGFCFLFRLRGKTILWASLGGALGWLVCVTLKLYGGSLGKEIPASFIAALAVTAYSELMARLTHKPVICYTIVAILPMVPGGGIYYTMRHCLDGNIALFAESGLHTLGVAGALAIGMLLVSSLARLASPQRRRLESSASGDKPPRRGEDGRPGGENDDL